MRFKFWLRLVVFGILLAAGCPMFAVVPPKESIQGPSQTSDGLNFDKFILRALPPDCCGTQNISRYGHHICISTDEFCNLLSKRINIPPTIKPNLLTYTPDPVLNIPPGQIFALPFPSNMIPNPINRKGQVALVVGASRGNGKFIAKALAKAGMKVIGTSRFPDRQKQPNAFKLSEVPLDVSSESSVANFFEKVIKPIGSIDVLVCNANFAFAGFCKDITGDDLKDQFNVTCAGQQRVIQNALPFMRHSNKTRVITIASAAGTQFIFAGGSPYAVSKIALQTLSDTFNVEEAILKARGVVPAGPFFSVVEPYFVETLISGYEYSIPSTVDKSDFSVLAQQVFNLANDWLNPTGAIPPTTVGDAVLSIAISQQPGARYLVANPNATIDIEGVTVPLVTALIDLHVAPIDFVINATALGFNTFYDESNTQRKMILEAVCPSTQDNLKCGRAKQVSSNPCQCKPRKG